MKSVKTAMNTRDIHIVCSVLKVVQQLVLCKGVGIALQDYYRQFLPVCNIMKDKHLGAGGNSPPCPAQVSHSFHLFSPLCCKPL
jgi:hypothetical protein